MAGVVLALAIWACVTWWSATVLTVGNLALTAATTLAGILLGATVTRFLAFPRRLTVGLGASIAGWLAVWIHLRFFEPRFLQRGRHHLRSDQTLQWIRENRALRRARQNRRGHVRPRPPGGLRPDGGSACSPRESAIQGAEILAGWRGSRGCGGWASGTLDGTA